MLNGLVYNDHVVVVQLLIYGIHQQQPVLVEFSLLLRCEGNIRMRTSVHRFGSFGARDIIDIIRSRSFLGC